MSRSRRALAEGCASTMSALRGLGRRLTETQGSGCSDRISADPPLTHLKWMAITSVVALALAPATALGKTSHRQSPMTQPKNRETAVAARGAAPARQTLAPGAGYTGAHGSALVRALQRKLAAAGFTPGPIDGRYGPLTKRAVIGSQAAHGLQIDGIAGPQTLGALARSVLYPGAGYADVNGSPSVRALQRKLAAARFAPGPIDGLYGPLTERAVTKFQAARGLHADGTVDAHTFAALRAKSTRARSARTSTHSRTTPVRRPAASAPRRHHVRASATTPRPAPGSSLPVGWIVLIAALGTCLLVAVVVRTPLHGRADAEPASPREPQPQPDGNSERSPVPVDASNGQERDPEAVRRRLEQGANAGESDAMNHLAVLLQGTDPAGARRWYERAANAGHSNAMFNLGLLLQGTDPEGARRWWERAADAGNTKAMVSLGVMLIDEDPDAARRWWERAGNAGNTNAMFNLGLLLDDSDPGAARYWLERAANAGHKGAIDTLGGVAPRP